MTKIIGSQTSRLAVVFLCSVAVLPAMAQAQAVDQDTEVAIEVPEPVLGQVLGADPLAPIAPQQALGRPGGNVRGTTATPANPLVTLGFSSRLFHEDDDGETETTLGFGLNGGVFSETRNQRFSLTASTLAEFGDDDPEFTDTLFNLSYAYFTRRTELSANLGFSEFDVDSPNTVLGADFEDDDLSTDDGTRQVSNARLRLVTGRGTRFSTNTTLGFRSEDFAGTIDPNLIPETTVDVGTFWTFVIDPRLTLRSFATVSRTDQDDALNTLETDIRYGLGADVLIDQAWTGDIQFAVTDERVETDAGGGRSEVSDAGFEFDLGVTRALRNGTLRFSYAHDQSEDDQIDSFTVARALDLANGAALSASGGVISFETGDIFPFLGVNYNHEVLRGHTIALSLEQSGDQNDDDEDILRTQAAATYTYELTPRSQLSLNGRVASIDVLEGVAVDTLNTSFGIRYTHELAQDWAFVARADRRTTFEDGTETNQNTTLSLDLERQFSFRP